MFVDLETPLFERGACVCWHCKIVMLFNQWYYFWIGFLWILLGVSSVISFLGLAVDILTFLMNIFRFIFFLIFILFLLVKMNSTIKTLDHLDHLCQLYQEESVARRNLRTELDRCCVHTVCTRSRMLNIRSLFGYWFLKEFYQRWHRNGSTTVSPLDVIKEIRVYPCQSRFTSLILSFITREECWLKHYSRGGKSSSLRSDF